MFWNQKKVQELALELLSQHNSANRKSRSSTEKYLFFPPLKNNQRGLFFPPLKNNPTVTLKPNDLFISTSFIINKEKECLYSCFKTANATYGTLMEDTQNSRMVGVERQKIHWQICIRTTLELWSLLKASTANWLTSVN